MQGTAVQQHLKGFKFSTPVTLAHTKYMEGSSYIIIWEGMTSTFKTLIAHFLQHSTCELCPPARISVVGLSNFLNNVLYCIPKII